MFVIFGASTDIGQRLKARLQDSKLPVRSISRSGPDNVAADLATGVGLEAALDGAEVVISCAHARYAGRLLAALPPSVRRVVLMGSAWRYSRVPNPRADEVRIGEAQFLASGTDGVMLHSAMIYGGHHENNIQRLLRQIRNLPLILHRVAAGMKASHLYRRRGELYLLRLSDRLARPARGTIAGPRLTWHEMTTCARRIGRHPVLLPVPIMRCYLHSEP